MVRVLPPAPRSTVSETADSLQIVVPARRRWAVILFLAFWLCGWAAGEVAALAGLLGVGQAGDAVRAFLGLWLCLWTLGGGFALYALCWSLAGREVLTVTPEGLITRREVFGLGRSREFERDQVRDLRVAPVQLSYWNGSRNWSSWGMAPGVLVFDYGARTYRFGTDLDEAEAKMLLAAVRERFPDLVSAA